MLKMRRGLWGWLYEGRVKYSMHVRMILWPGELPGVSGVRNRFGAGEAKECKMENFERLDGHHCIGRIKKD
jgi:hypothetical protein